MTVKVTFKAVSGKTRTKRVQVDSLISPMGSHYIYFLKIGGRSFKAIKKEMAKLEVEL